MSIFTIMNGVAWALCALFAYLILSDLIKVEKAKREEKKSADQAEKQSCQALNADESAK